LTQRGGLYLTSQGELKVLIVFVRFKDDDSDHPYWPAGQPPQNYSTYIDPNLQTNSTHYNNLTHYYKKMSLGVYKVTGQAVYVETDENKAYYFNPANYLPTSPKHFATKKVLQDKVDPLINFNIYDNWSSSNYYQHSNQPDGTIDMIVMVWRASTTPFHFTDWGEASLGGYTSYTVENGTKTIKTGFGLNSGSGVTCHYWGERSPEINFKVIVHEIAHWLLGSLHPYDRYDPNNRHELWGMLSSPGDGICTNTYERERVAWINPTPITG
jgi:M6 family metalloprotease-like protein